MCLVSRFNNCWLFNFSCFVVFSHTTSLNNIMFSQAAEKKMREEHSKQANNFIIFRFPVDASNNCRKELSTWVSYSLRCEIKFCWLLRFHPREKCFESLRMPVIAHSNIFYSVEKIPRSSYFIPMGSARSYEWKNKSLKCVKILRGAQKVVLMFTRKILCIYFNTSGDVVVVMSLWLSTWNCSAVEKMIEAS